MADKIKLVLKYGEQRRSLYLNAHNKDDYGRHRGQVLYGMTLSGSGTVVTVAPGAIYTSQGQRLFFEVTDGSVDVGPAGLNVFTTDTDWRSAYPLCVMIYLSYTYDSQIATAVERTSAVGMTEATLTARVVPFDKNTGSPVYNLHPLDPVLLDQDNPQPGGYPSVQNWNEAAVHAPPAVLAVSNSDAAIQFGEIPLGYVLIGVDPATNAYPTNLDSAGVSIVTFRNAFESLSDLVGVDVLLPRQRQAIAADLVTAAGSALRQGFSARFIGTATSPAVANPHYGTPETDAYDKYRQSNFLRDGDSLLDSLRRMDIVLRQWMNRTGCQQIISTFQDGAGIIPAAASIQEILDASDGGTNPLTNINAITYNNGAVGPDPANHVLKDGVLTHVEASLTGKLGTSEGDSLKSAVEALDVALSLILTNVLGESIPRSALRDASGGTITPATWVDPPAGYPAQAVPTLSGVASLVNLDDESTRDAITEALRRALSGSGVNWMANSAFQAGSTLSGTQAALPPYWTMAGTGTWGLANRLQATRLGRALAVTLGASSALEQDIIGAANDNFIGQLLRSSPDVSISAAIYNSGANPLVLELIGYSDIAGTVPVFTIVTDAIPATDPVGLRLVTATAKISPSATVNRLKFRVRPATAINTAAFTIAGAAFNCGMPINVMVADKATDYLSRDGGSQQPMRGPLYMGAQQAKDAADATDPQDLVTKYQLDAATQALADLISDLSGGVSRRSPYSEWAIPSPAYGVSTIDLDGSITNITAGGVLMGTDVNITVGQTPTSDVHIFVDGNVSISGIITASGKIVEISATGDITISAAITAQDIRLRAGGTITVSAALTASSVAGVVTLDSLDDVIVSSPITAFLVFIYAVTNVTVSSTIRAYGGTSSATAWTTNYWNLESRFGRTLRDLISFGYDYMTPYSGAPGLTNAGGCGAVAGGRARAWTSSGGISGRASIARGVARPWLLPAAPGGPAGYDAVNTGNTGYGGGVIVVVCPGTGLFTGGVFNVDGPGGNAAGFAPQDITPHLSNNGGGAGTIKVAVRGLVTDGTYRAHGGNGRRISGSNDGGAGGGGTSYVVTGTAPAGVQTYDVVGGSNGDAGNPTGETGVSGTVVLASTAEWDDLRTQGFFGR